MSDQEKEKWERYKAVKSHFASTDSNATYQECISDEGQLYYMTMCFLYEAFMKLGGDDKRKVKSNEKWIELED